MVNSYIPLSFFKYSGCGNDFILFSDISSNLHSSIRRHAKEMCCRRTGIGADGIILISSSENSDAKLTIINADGSLAEMCGNGARCVVRCLHDDLGMIKECYVLETDSGFITASISGSEVEILLAESAAIEGPHQTEYGTVYYTKVGVPHAVLLNQNLEKVDVDGIGRKLRHSPLFGKEGANVNFVAQLDLNRIAVRTYERGVESETPACGTGCAASAIISAYINQTEQLCHTLTKSGLSIRYQFQLKKNTALSIVMRGEACYCFNGIYRLPIIKPLFDLENELRAPLFAAVN